MKTVLEWFGELPAGYRELAISNYGDGEWHRKKYGCRSFPVHSIISALVAGFDWESSPQGDLFWDQVCEFYSGYSDGKQLPSIDGKTRRDELLVIRDRLRNDPYDYISFCALELVLDEIDGIDRDNAKQEV